MKKKTGKSTKYFPIFKTGTLTDSRGRDHHITTADLDQIEKSYNQKGPGWKEAPVVTGHPKTNAPAFGWIENVRRIGNKLYAKAKEVAPAFADQVKQKMYKYVSPSFRPDGTLRHVGFLGATPPAIAGLGEATPAFADFAGDEEYESYKIEFSEMEAGGLLYIVEQMQKGIAALRDHIDFADEDTGDNEAGAWGEEPEGIEEGEADAPAGEPGDEDATEAEPEADEPEVEASAPAGEDTGDNEAGAGDEPGAAVSGDEAPATEDTNNKNQTNIKETLMKNKKKKKGLKKDPEKKVETPPGAAIEQDGDEIPETEFSEPGVKDELAALRAEVEKLKTEKVTDKAASFAEGLVNQGKLLPKLKHGLTGILTRLDNTESFDFAEAGAEEPDEKTILQAVMDFCEAALGERIPLKAIKRGKGPVTGSSDDDTDDYSEADPDQMELDKKVKAEMAKDQNIDYAEALNRVKKGGK